jgi:hypothetical protein
MSVSVFFPVSVLTDVLSVITNNMEPTELRELQHGLSFLVVVFLSLKLLQ